MYTIALDQERALIKVRLFGFWTPTTFANYRHEILALTGTLGDVPGGHATLCDISGALIQPKEIIDGFQKLIGGAPIKSRRIAIHTNSPLSRMQGRRITSTSATLGVFATEAEALAWLFEGVEPLVSARKAA